MSPEARKQRFLESGDAYFKDGKISEAVIEYRNAVQIDGRFGPARLGLARSHEKLGELPALSRNTFAPQICCRMTERSRSLRETTC